MITAFSKYICDKLYKNHTWRKRYPIESRVAMSISINNGIYQNFTSNDYLNLSQHPRVCRDFARAANQYGLGSSGSALVTGYHRSHQILEEAFANFVGREKALLFNSGYHANLAIVQAIANRHTLVVSDKYCHASLLDGIQLSRAKHRRFMHNNCIQAAKLLDESTAEKILITEGVFSMEGNISPLLALSQLSHDKKAIFCVDDAHGFGVLGKTGAGSCEHFGLTQQDVPCLVQPLGKALGSMGAMVSGSGAFIETLIQCSRTYRYTTAMPPAVASATLTALTILNDETWRRIQLLEHILLFNKLAKKHQLPLCSWDNTPIRSVLVGSNLNALKLQNTLQERGYIVACIRAPTVPESTARLRISLCSEHTKESIEGLVHELISLRQPPDRLCEKAQ